jgi:hypothetical protein
MPFVDLPSRGEHLAPSFDGGTEELGCYFSELEALFMRHTITTDEDKKAGALRYLATAALERTWKASNTYTDLTKTYAEFKAEIHKFYPGSSDNVFTIHHLDMLIGERAQLGICNTTELGDFHLQFRTISKYLIDKHRMSQAEETQGFLHVLQPELENQVRQRLQITDLQHDPQDLYKLGKLYEAAAYCLLGSVPAGSMGAIRSVMLLAPQPPPVNIKSELQNEVQSVIKSAVSKMTEMFKNVFTAQAQFTGAVQTSQLQAHAPTIARPLQDQGSKCNFCGEIGHFMRDCEVVKEYMHMGKCKHNHKNWIVLPSGATVPRSITGAWLCDHIDEYHWLNPNRQGTAQILCKVASTVTVAMLIQAEAEPSKQNKVTRFEPELGQPGVYAYRKQSSSKGKAKEAAPPRIVEIHSEDDSTAEPTRFTNEFPPVVPQPPDSDTDGAAVEHPFAKPSLTHDLLGKADSDPLPPRKSERTYTMTSQIYDAKVAHKVFEQILSTGITLSQRDLLLLAPELRTKIADATVHKHIARTDAQAVLENIPEVAPARSSEAHMPASFSKTIHELPANMTIIKDPYKALLRQQLCGECSGKPVKVATKSNTLRAILPTIADQEQVEAILDPGCQIVAMSEEVCIVLSIAYDPNVCLNMVSVNGGIDQSLGLAKNIPFKIGEITVYLQVHILCQPAYDILLGRPFDVLTESVVVNYRDENQTITILDVTDRPVTRRKSVTFDSKAKVGALV